MVIGSIMAVHQMSGPEVPVDNALIARCLSGDQDAWRDLVQRYQRLIYSVAYKMCPQQDDASDVFQQVWMELHRQLADLRNVQALPAWLITVTRRKALHFLRTKYGTEQLDDDLPDLSPVIDSIEKEHTIERALDQVSERRRRLIGLLYFRVVAPS